MRRTGGKVTLEIKKQAIIDADGYALTTVDIDADGGTLRIEQDSDTICLPLNAVDDVIAGLCALAGDQVSVPREVKAHDLKDGQEFELGGVRFTVEGDPDEEGDVYVRRDSGAHMDHMWLPGDVTVKLVGR
jgi:hypothetical protein